MADIVLRDVEKYFGNNYIIRKLNLSIKDREFVVLLGPSGCGKTTTLRAIAGLEEIDTGDILIDGKAVQSLHASERDIAFVFQLFALYPHLTAFENIAFPLRATGQAPSVIASEVRRVAKAIGIEHLLELRPSALSGGDMQRIAIGRALVRRPKAMLMDEPIGALDAKLREDMRTELKRLHIENGSTTIYVTHDQIEAMALADRIAIMNDGVLQQVGTPTDVYLNPVNLFVAQFIGSPVMNIFDATINEGKVKLGDATESIPFAGSIPVKAREGFKLGIRAESVKVHHDGKPNTVAMAAHLIEPLGSHDIVDLKLGTGFLRARTPSGFVSAPGATVHVELDTARTHFFDSATGTIISGTNG